MDCCVGVWSVAWSLEFPALNLKPEDVQASWFGGQILGLFCARVAPSNFYLNPKGMQNNGFLGHI